MGKPKCPECKAGAPDWLVSYGDMTTLLLCFFVFLLVTAKMDVDKLKAASGYMRDKMGLLPESVSQKSETKSDMARTGTAGQNDQVLSIDEGKKFVLGGREKVFERGSAVPILPPEYVERILEFCKQIRGLRNIIEIRGHTGNDELEGSTFRTEMDLSYERAKAIRDFLKETGNIREERMRLIACSQFERFRSNLFFSTEDQNRRVEIRVTKKYQDFNPNTSIK